MANLIRPGRSGMASFCVRRYGDASLAIFRGPRKLADYDRLGKLVEVKIEKAA